jgi:hypothetical protein
MGCKTGITVSLNAHNKAAKPKNERKGQKRQIHYSADKQNNFPHFSNAK